MSETQEGFFLRMPNDWIDKALPTMGHAELKVVLIVIRQTIGWHKERDAISLSQFEAKTGLTRSNVMRGIRDAVNHGWIRVYRQGNRSLYQPCLADGIASIPVADSTVSVPEIVLKQYHDGTEAVPKLVPKQYTQKKGKTLNKRQGKKSHIDAQARDVESTQPGAIPSGEIDWFADDPAPQPETKQPETKVIQDEAPASTETLKRVRKARQQLSEHEAARHKELFAGLARICVMDTKLRSVAGQIARAAKELREGDPGADDATMTEFLEWWKTSDFRGRSGKPPTPQQVIVSWKLFRGNYAERPSHGINHPQRGMSLDKIMTILADIK